MTLTTSTVSGNSATASGGGIDDVFATLTLTSSTVSDNSALDGGGIAIPDTLGCGGCVTLTNFHRVG
jgi:hypothetical protein